MDIQAKVIEVMRQYPVKRAAFFGSIARGDETPESDVDILVEFSQPVGLDFFGLHVNLEEALERHVDLVTYDALTDTDADFKHEVEKDARVIYEN